MNKVHVSTISLSSRSMRDLKQQLEDLAVKTKDDGRIYERGEFYEPVPGYVAIDVFVFLPAEVVQAFRAMESFNSDENENGKVH